MVPALLRRCPLLLAGASLVMAAATGHAAGDFPAVTYEQFELSNGLRVILSVDTSAPVVATFVHYHVGAKNERPDRTGFAHFFEHLMFEATDNIPRKGIDEILEDAGAQRNASTTADETYYWIKLPANQLKLALWIESERMLHAKVEQIGVETQRSVVKEEKKVRLDNQPYSSFHEHLHAHLAKGTPYEWLPIGSAQFIDQATLEEFRDFYKTYYIPNNAVLSVVGDIDIAETRTLVTEYFSGIPRGREIVRPNFSIPLGTAEQVYTINEEKTPLPGRIYGYRTVGRGHPDAYALSLLSQILAAGNSSRMRRSLVDDKRIALETVAFASEQEKAGFFKMIVIGNPTATMQQLGAAMDAEILRIQQEGVTAREFQKALNQFRTAYASRFNDVLGKAQSLATYAAIYGDPNLINSEIERTMRLKPEDLQRVARHYLVPANRVVLNYTVGGEGGAE